MSENMYEALSHMTPQEINEALDELLKHGLITQTGDEVAINEKGSRWLEIHNEDQRHPPA